MTSNPIAARTQRGSASTARLSASVKACSGPPASTSTATAATAIAAGSGGGGARRRGARAGGEGGEGEGGDGGLGGGLGGEHGVAPSIRPPRPRYSRDTLWARG